MPTSLPRDDRKQTIQVLQPGVTQVIVMDTESQATTAITNTSVIRVLATADCHIVVGVSPTATLSDLYIPANVPEYFEIGQDGNNQLAVVQDSAGGTIYITEML